MLNEKNVVATIAVKDLDRAKRFYEDKLGLQETETDGQNYIAYKSGKTAILVYKSEFAGGYKATVATWDAGDEIAEIVKTLKQRGVAFEHYDMPGMKREGDIHIAGAMQNAWCKDPDGNILSFVSG